MAVITMAGSHNPTLVQLPSRTNWSRHWAKSPAAPVRVHCAGRTDTGVHAFSQIIHFDTPVTRSCKAWVIGGNTSLPRDIRIHWAVPVAATSMRGFARGPTLPLRHCQYTDSAGAVAGTGHLASPALRCNGDAHCGTGAAGRAGFQCFSRRVLPVEYAHAQCAIHRGSEAW